MNDAKKREASDLLERGTFNVILREDVPKYGKVLPERFFLAVQSAVDGEHKYKARFVIGRHPEKLKDMMVHSTSTLQPQSFRLLLALDSIFDFSV